MQNDNPNLNPIPYRQTRPYRASSYVEKIPVDYYDEQMVNASHILMAMSNNTYLVNKDGFNSASNVTTSFEHPVFCYQSKHQPVLGDNYTPSYARPSISTMLNNCAPEPSYKPDTAFKSRANPMAINSLLVENVNPDVSTSTSESCNPFKPILSPVMSVESCVAFNNNLTSPGAEIKVKPAVRRNSVDTKSWKPEASTKRGVSRRTSAKKEPPVKKSLAKPVHTKDKLKKIDSEVSDGIELSIHTPTDATSITFNDDTSSETEGYKKVKAQVARKGKDKSKKSGSKLNIA